MDVQLLFVLSEAEALPSGRCQRAELEEAQRRGPRGGFALRLFSLGQHPVDDLGRLPADGRLTGADRRSPDGYQLICDSVVPHFDPQKNWLGVYEPESDSRSWCRCLDRLALSSAGNQTCWFYPSHDGRFLSWEQRLSLGLGLGRIAEPPAAVLEAPYARSQLAVLWTLLGDDTALTCVGLTYGGQRIDWPLLEINPEPMATWSHFCVDTQADQSLRVVSSQTLFVPPNPANTTG